MVYIQLDSVTFSYPGSEMVALFSDFSLEIPEGEWVALVGPSAAGKTTLLKLVKGLLQPQDGEIRINGTALITGEL
ncbi:MAG: ATP-binding cassette domain-containing protein, partial [Desulfobacterales bacterium]|nr:ATP-binding cassette domain-containing protein [Desulfobacterales bacterium]